MNDPEGPPQGQKPIIERARRLGSKLVDVATRRGFGRSGKDDQTPPSEPADKEARFITATKRELDEVHASMTRVELGIDVSRDIFNARRKFIGVLDTMYPTEERERRFQQDHGVKILHPEQVGTTPEALLEDATFIATESVKDWRQSGGTVELPEEFRAIIDDDVALAKSIAIRQTFFPLGMNEPGTNPDMGDKDRAFTSLFDLLGVSPEEAGMDPEEWDKIKKDYFRFRYKYKEGADTPDVPYWGKSIQVGMLLNGLEPEDVKPDYNAADRDNFSDFALFRDSSDEDVEAERRHEEMLTDIVTPFRRVHRLNPNYNSPLWGRGEEAA